MRQFLALLAFLATCFCATQTRSAEGTNAALAGDGPDCTSSTATGGDIRVITCTLPAGRPHRLAANFSGGHDDTSASLSATLDGQPANCDSDSKTRLFGEDGDVSVYCRISASGDLATTHKLVVTVLWSHAQYRNFTFVAD